MRKFDYINMGQGPLDLMITAGIIADDDMEHIIPGQWAWDLDKENPRVEITIVDYQSAGPDRLEQLELAWLVAVNLYPDLEGLQV